MTHLRKGAVEYSIRHALLFAAKKTSLNEADGQAITAKPRQLAHLIQLAAFFALYP